MADIQFKFENYWGQPAYDFNGDFERGTLNGTVDFWSVGTNGGGTSGSFYQSNEQIFKNKYSLFYVRSSTPYDIRSGSFILIAGTYRFTEAIQSHSGSAVHVSLIDSPSGISILIKNAFMAGFGSWSRNSSGSFILGSTGTYYFYTKFFIPTSIGSIFYDSLILYKQGIGTVNYTLALDDMPTYPYSFQTTLREIRQISYYGQIWNYPVYKKKQWTMNFQEASETCKNNFQGLLEQNEDIFFYDNIQNVGTTGGTYIVRIDPDSFKPQTPYYNVWNFQIILDEVESVGF